MTMVLLFAAVLALVLIDVPIAVSLGIVAVLAMLASHGVGSLPNVAVVTYNGATNFPLLAIPLFILAGAIMRRASVPTPTTAASTSRTCWWGPKERSPGRAR